MRKERVVIVGGSSGMGLALATELVAQGTEVTIAGRSADRLEAVDLPVRKVVTDVGDEQDVERLFKTTGPVDHIVTTAADISGSYQPIREYDVAAARSAIESKLIGPLLLAKHGAPVIEPGGSIVFTSGIAAYRPGPRGSMVAALNGGLGSMAAALAVELAPIRVNVVSPGWVDTPIWQGVAGDAKDETLAAMAARLPVGRIGRTNDIAEAIIALLRNGFITGTVLHADGGHRLV
ncbi:NAD(P)-dependent dehydrogenase (short-subunit alcohol dehydrogenase family) [Kribbella voronezhensis]|uniref:NAD(P)-dependent dehydrogenase (Short-subunit alcohol dehydrogenase family) n=1 Tax=Kribbella voronezhensis TaxID=2512212 RepID=A0A4R7TEF7_9ACTN|nr:SDR family oxidoreductase [Kribbella voronezhensis]TDU90525.1 NAD(P)-dependent dehydrogenase (short-subunit alcohol dehydrogenase family) [Kribbella voronezhensis]